MVSLVLSAISVYLIYWQIKSLTDNLRERDAVMRNAEQRQAGGASDSASALREMLSLWLGSSYAASSNLQQVRAMLDEVTTQSEEAAASIGRSFRVVMNKTGQQMDDAVRLLKSNSDGAGGSTWLSLPDFIKAYEKQLDTVTGRMMDFSKASEEMSRHQDMVREHSLAIDEMLDELRNMAARIRKLALDSTVAANRDQSTDTRWFIEIADRIRETSTSAHELTRRMRDGLELIREVLPAVRRVGIVGNAADPFHKPFLASIEAAARTLNVELKIVLSQGADPFPATFAEVAGSGVQAMMVQPSLPRDRAAELALRYRLPLFVASTEAAEAGALMAYGADIAAVYRQSATFVDKILKGRKPADLPVELATKFRLVVNLKTANALGLTLSPNLLNRADYVIE